MRSEALPTVGFIGAGRVARALAPALRQAGYAVRAIASRSAASADALASEVGAEAVSTQDAVDRCELVFLAVPDDAIASAAESLAWREGQAAVHLSGALGLDALTAAADSGAATGAFHPVQTFGGAGTQISLEGVTFGIDAEPPLYGVLAAMAERLGGRALRVPSGARALYHAGAVLACGCVTALLAEAMDAWERAGLPRAEAQAALSRMAETTVANVGAAGPGEALTGPIVRGDAATVRAHVAALRAAAPHALETYAAIGKRAAALAATNGRGGGVDWNALFEEAARCE